MAQLLASTTIGNTAPAIGLISESFITTSNSITLSNSVSNTQTIVSVGGIIQVEDVDYTINDNVVSFSDSYIESVSIEVKYLYTAE